MLSHGSRAGAHGAVAETLIINYIISLVLVSLALSLILPLSVVSKRTITSIQRGMLLPFLILESHILPPTWQMFTISLATKTNVLTFIFSSVHIRLHNSSNLMYITPWKPCFLSQPKAFLLFLGPRKWLHTVLHMHKVEGILKLDRTAADGKYWDWTDHVDKQGPKIYWNFRRCSCQQMMVIGRHKVRKMA